MDNLWAGGAARGVRFVMMLFAIGPMAMPSVSEATEFFSLRPCRLMDTRQVGGGGAIGSDAVRVVQVSGSCGVPASAEAVALSVVATGQTSAGHLLIYPAGEAAPISSSLNFDFGENIANNGIRKLSGSGQIALRPFVLGSGSVHLIVDVHGYFSFDDAPATGAEGPLLYNPIQGCRVFNSETQGGQLLNGQARAFSVQGAAGCGVPVGAKGAVLNFEAVNPSGFGHLKLWPSDNAEPSSSFLNVVPGRPLGNGVVIGLGAAPGDLVAKLEVAGSTPAVAEVYGFFAAGSGASYVPLSGCRAIDTRSGAPLRAGTRFLGLREACGLPPRAVAAHVNFTVVHMSSSGSLVGHRSDFAPPPTSNLTFVAGEGALGNGAVVGLSDDGSWADAAVTLRPIDPSGTTHLIVDVFGYFLGGDSVPKGGDSSSDHHASLDRGFTQNAFQMGDIESVNLLNGNVTVTLPIGRQYPVGGGLSYGLTLAYNSKIWDFDERFHQGAPTAEAVPHRLSNAGMGWALHLGRLLDSNDVENKHFRPVYVDPAGGEHVFYKVLNAFDGDSRDVAEAGFEYTRDGTYLRLRSFTQAGREVREVESPDGVVHRFEEDQGPAGQRRDRFRLAQIRNRFVNAQGAAANTVNLSYVVPADDPQAEEWRITDSHGRTQRVRFRPDPTGWYPRLLSSVHLTRFGSAASADYLFTYDFPSITRPCGDSYPLNSATLVVPKLSRIDLPDGTSYRPEIWESNPQTCHAHGMLRSLGLRTGGRIEWDYGSYHLPIPGCSVRDWHTDSAGVRRRRFFDGNTLSGEWTYTPATSQPPPAPPLPCDDGTTMTQFPPEEMTNTVQTPLGDRFVYYFSVFPGTDRGVYPGPFRKDEYGLPFTRRVSDGGGRFLSWEAFDCEGSTCRLRRRQMVRYESDAGIGAPLGNFCTPQQIDDDCTNQQWRLAAERMDYFEDDDATVDRHADTDYSDFDGLGHYRSVVYNGDFPGRNQRTVQTRYNPGRGRYQLVNDQPGLNHTFNMVPMSAPWILGTYSFTSQSEGTSAQRTDYCFDANTGFLDRIRIHKLGSATLRPQDIVMAYDHDTAGNVVTEAYHGGDATPLGVPPGGDTACGNPQNPFAGTAYFGSSLYAFGTLSQSSFKGVNGETLGGSLDYRFVDNQIDRNTGLVAASTDPSGIVTQFEYDALGRPTWIMPASSTPGQASQGDRWFQVEYLPPAAAARVPCAGAPLEVATTSAAVCVTERDHGNKNAPVLAQQMIVSDGLGRVTLERRKLPGGSWNLRQTLYNGMNWEVSVLDFGMTAPTIYSGYDPFGRAGRIHPPDGPANGSRDITSTYGGVRSVTRKGKMGVADDADRRTTLEEVSTSVLYDRFGRVHAVQQPAPGHPCAINGMLETNYTYDYANRITGVTWNTNGCGNQARTFAYDGRGFMTFEDHPEKTANVAGLNHDVDYLAYDAMGNVTRKADGENHLRFQYDRAGRLEEIVDFATGRPLKEYDYGQGRTGTNRSMGRTVTAIRHNYMTGVDAPAPSDIVVTTTNTYGGRGGRVSARTVTASNTGGFSQTFSWSPRGEVASLGYPNCTFANCSGSPTPAPIRSLSYGYAEGFLTSIGGFASSISYHANEMVARVRMANGRDWRQDIGPQGMLRPHFICVPGTNENRPCEELGGLGPYQYDPLGNVIAVGGEAYLYDRLGRVVRGISGGGLAQSYAFDAFGNITAITTGTETRTVPTDSATNRLLWPTLYDSGGNQRTWNSQAFTYDRFDQVVTHSGGGNDNLYLYTADDERLLSWDRARGISHWRLRDLDGKVLRDYAQQSGTQWTWSRDYIWGGGTLIAAVSPAETRYFYPDHLGTLRFSSNQGNANPISHHYFPFGEELSPSSDPEPMRFSGHERDFNVISGIDDDYDNMHARRYSTRLARFLTVDPATPLAASVMFPQSWNRYTYAWGNPLKYTDPTGKYVVDCVVGNERCAEDAKAFEVARQDSLGSADQAIVATALAYGNPGEENGITVAFGKPGTGLAGDTAVRAQAGREGAGMVLIGNVVIKSGLRGTELVAAVAHEGQHLVDGQGFVNSFAGDLSDWDVTKNLTVAQTEAKAYQITHSIFKRAGQAFSQEGCSGCNLGEGVKTPAEVRRAIDSILANPRGPYHDKLNARQFGDWPPPGS